MEIHIKTHLRYSASAPCDVLLQIEAANHDQRIVSENLNIVSAPLLHHVAGESGVGQRIWLQVDGELDCTYEARVAINRPAVNLSALKQSALPDLPGHVIQYLMPSRYCHPEQFFEFTKNTFGELAGGALVSAMCDWIAKNFTYEAGASDVQTRAHDTFQQRKGVCRDYAHVLIALARAVAIPARFVSAYAPHVTPQDFHAVVEVYLDGAWHLVDPTKMAEAEEIVRIGVGRDAADVSFLTAYGLLELKQQSVEVQRLSDTK